MTNKIRILISAGICWLILTSCGPQTVIIITATPPPTIVPTATPDPLAQLTKAEANYLLVAVNRLEILSEALDCASASSETARGCSDTWRERADEWEAMSHPKSMDSIHLNLYLCQSNTARALSYASYYSDDGDPDDLYSFKTNVSDAQEYCGEALAEINSVMGK